MRQPSRAVFSPVAVLLTAFSFWLAAAAPIVSAQETVSIPHSWKAGDRVRYEVVRTASQDNMKLQGRSELTIEIIEADDRGFLISWKYGPWELTQSAKAPLSAKIQNLAMGRLETPARLRFLPGAQDLKVENWKELRDALLLSAEGVAKEMALSQKATEAALGPMRAIYENEAMVARTFGKHANVFFIIYCMTLPMAQPVEYPVRLPNPFFDVDLPGTARFSVKTVGEAGRGASIEWTQTLDTAAVPQIMDRLLAGLESALGTRLPPGFTIQELDAGISTQYDADLVTGWHDRLTYRSRTAINALVQEETVTMTRIDRAPR